MSTDRPYWLTDEKLGEAVELANRVVHNEQPERVVIMSLGQSLDAGEGG